ncbi:ethanolamine utilization protein EutQ [Bacillus sp. 491mf]|uniref:cupin domain-containing protein n=1 Tax=Bacillus TaxID=1386 RepID=UPI0005524CFB|nr:MULTISPECIES: cupin domain-containing protein [unclassified Bacillus (in: firmicutes)]SFC48870.1 ethanolamine utilization protein EutQ [Bacillus sp. 491mf]
MNTLDKQVIEDLVRKIIAEKIGNTPQNEMFSRRDESGVISVQLPTVKVAETDRLNTGKQEDIVYCKDIFSLEESPRLGCGIMEMKETTFDWTLNYDEIDYVIEGKLEVIIDGRKVSAQAGEIILIPKGTKIQFSVPEYARFMYVTYPADWASQA